MCTDWGDMMSGRGLPNNTILHERYKIVKVLGEGGFGVTYLATDIESGLYVAVKEYSPDKSFDEVEFEKGLNRFIKEADVLKEYSYLEGIVRVWDCFKAENTAYIVMDYIDGITLKKYVALHGRFDYDELLEMMLPVMKSLVTLHRHGLIHRDISPDNLMIGMDNNMYLIDFGAASRIIPDKTTTVLLKAGYAPPEQYLHDGELGAWTDVYGLCAVIYTALSGRTPTDAIARLQGKVLVSLAEQEIDIDDWKNAAVMRGMAIRPAERYRDVNELINALTVAPTDEDLVTVYGNDADLDIVRNSDKSVRMNKWWFARAGITVVAAFIIIAVLLNKGGPSLYTDDTSAPTTEAKTEAISESDTEEKRVLCKMPDVTGMKLQDAKTAIRQVDGKIIVKTENSFSDIVDKGGVISQNVAPDTSYNEGAISEVILTVSKGIEINKSSDRNNRQESTTQESISKKDSYDVKSDGNEAEDFYLD